MDIWPPRCRGSKDDACLFQTSYIIIYKIKDLSRDFPFFVDFAVPLMECFPRKTSRSCVGMRQVDVARFRLQAGGRGAAASGTQVRNLTEIDAAIASSSRKDLFFSLSKIIYHLHTNYMVDPLVFAVALRYNEGNSEALLRAKGASIWNSSGQKAAISAIWTVSFTTVICYYPG